jgi:hypothetical protein
MSSSDRNRPREKGIVTDPRKERDAGTITSPDSPRKQASQQQDESSRTEGTDRDFDESGESINLGHGHPREERGAGEAGGGKSRPGS